MADYNFLGIDGGATKTSAVILDAAGKEVSRGYSAGSNFAVSGLGRSLDNLYAAISGASTGVYPQNFKVCLAMAGIDTQKQKEMLQKAITTHRFLSKFFRIPPLIINDSQAALRSGTNDKNALVIVSGTGSNCYGKNETGKEAKSGGYNYILSDEGSAYDIGSKILKSITRYLDGRGQTTLLKDIVFKNLKISTLEDLSSLVYEKPWDKTDIGQMAPYINEAAAQKDPVALQIIDSTALELALMAKSVIQSLNLKDKKFTLVTSGSVFKIGEILLQKFYGDIKTFSPNVVFTFPQKDTATGAAYLAAEQP